MDWESGSAEMEQFRSAARRRETERQGARVRRRRRALVLASRAAVLLRDEFGAERVALFGSVREEGLFFEGSDVDLAVWGLPEEHYLRAVSRLLSLDPGIPVDLVRVEDARPTLRTVIDEEGVPL